MSSENDHPAQEVQPSNCKNDATNGGNSDEDNGGKHESDTTTRTLLGKRRRPSDSRMSQSKKREKTLEIETLLRILSNDCVPIEERKELSRKCLDTIFDGKDAPGNDPNTTPDSNFINSAPSTATPLIQEVDRQASQSQYNTALTPPIVHNDTTTQSNHRSNDLTNSWLLDSHNDYIEKLLLKLPKLSWYSPVFSNAQEAIDRLPIDDRNELSRKWNVIQDEFFPIVEKDPDFLRDMLEYKSGIKTVTVMKDIQNDEGYYDIHRKYEVKDTLLQKILRCNPPKDIQECLAKSSTIYEASQQLFDIVEKTRLSDDHWKTFRQEFDKLEKEESNEGYGFNRDEIKRVFLIRHTHREDTILNLCARRIPPLAVIELIFSKAGRESTCVVDCKQWDWIPMQYAIFHNYRPEVVKALIPTKDDCSEESSQYSDYHLCASKATDEDYEDIIFQRDYH